MENHNVICQVCQVYTHYMSGLSGLSGLYTFPPFINWQYRFLLLHYMAIP